jgi:transcriptional regulator with XRE-family HTH domain
MTQARLAELVGINTRQVSRYELKQTVPPSDVLARIARALHVSTDYLFLLTDDETGRAELSELTLDERVILRAALDGDFEPLLHWVARKKRRASRKSSDV